MEAFAGISDSREELPQLPDGIFLPPIAMSCGEREVKARIEKPLPGRRMSGLCAWLRLPGRGPSPQLAAHLPPCQNPSLTLMALTARAVDYAVRELRVGRV